MTDAERKLADDLLETAARHVKRAKWDAAWPEESDRLLAHAAMLVSAVNVVRGFPACEHVPEAGPR